MNIESGGTHEWIPRLFATAAVLSVLATPVDGTAQAICSAPHSSPTLAQSGEIRTLPPGAGWFQVSAYGYNASEFYNRLGERRPFPFVEDTEFKTRSVFITAAVGLIDGLEVWAQMPMHRLSQQWPDGSRLTTGVGDVRFATRVGAELFGLDLPIAVRMGAKMPGSTFPVDATILPLTEGQKDFEVSLEGGRSLGDLPIYAVGWVGYRWRGENSAAAREPGDERYAHAAVGGLVGDLSWEVAADGLWGGAPIAQRVALTGEKRRLIQLLGTVGYAVGPGRLEVISQLPLDGANLPAAVALSVGYRTTWGL